MATRITILPNDTNKDQATQNSQISLAIINTASTINSTIGGSILSGEMGLNSDLTTGSSSLTNMFKCTFTNQSNNIVVFVSFCASSSSLCSVDLQIDGKSVLAKPYIFNTGSSDTIIPISINQQISGIQNATHQLQVLWSVTSGTATVYSNSTSSVQIMQYY